MYIVEVEVTVLDQVHNREYIELYNISEGFVVSVVVSIGKWPTSVCFI